jgi:hypothetical protein
MIQALADFSTYANSDEFYATLKIDKLAGGNTTDVEKSVKAFRECLDRGEKIDVVWKRYAPFSSALGGWSGYVINQNPKKTLSAVERSAHWLHEVSHYCGFTHIDNSIAKYPVIEQSFPYQIGYKFEAFLKTKQTSRLAGAP